MTLRAGRAQRVVDVTRVLRLFNRWRRTCPEQAERPGGGVLHVWLDDHNPLSEWLVEYAKANDKLAGLIATLAFQMSPDDQTRLMHEWDVAPVQEFLHSYERKPRPVADGPAVLRLAKDIPIPQQRLRVTLVFGERQETSTSSTRSSRTVDAVGMRASKHEVDDGN